jgi:hypothetical protein
MSRKPTKGYFVRGQFVAEGSELDLELKRELKGSVDMSKTDLKKHSDHLQELGESLLTLNASVMRRLQLAHGLSDKLTDAVAEALSKPFSAISIEMVYRSLYFFTNARQRGETDDVVTFLANKANLLGILKRKHKEENPSPLIFIPMLLTGFSNP